MGAVFHKGGSGEKRQEQSIEGRLLGEQLEEHTRTLLHASHLALPSTSKNPDGLSMLQSPTVTWARAQQSEVD